MIGFMNNLSCEACGKWIEGGYVLYPEDADPMEQVIICNPCRFVTMEEGK